MQSLLTQMLPHYRFIKFSITAVLILYFAVLVSAQRNENRPGVPWEGPVSDPRPQSTWDPKTTEGSLLLTASSVTGKWVDSYNYRWDLTENASGSITGTVIGCTAFGTVTGHSNGSSFTLTVHDPPCLDYVYNMTFLTSDIASGTWYNLCNGAPCGGSTVTMTREGCGEEQQKLIDEYEAFNVPLTPECEDLTQTRRSIYFSFGELNTGDYSWALINDPLIVPASSGYGLDKWREEFGRARIVNSAYRNPGRNQRVGGATSSRHMFGDAVDLRNVSRTIEEWNGMRAAARNANADYLEPLDGPCGIGCHHADWRRHPQGYSRPAEPTSEDPALDNDLLKNSSGALKKALQFGDWKPRAEIFFEVKQKVGMNARPRLSKLPSDFKWKLILLFDLENSYYRANNRTSDPAAENSLSEEYLVYYSDLLDVVSSLEDERSLNVLLEAIDRGNMATRAISSFGLIALDGTRAMAKSNDPDVRHAAATVMVQMITGENAFRLDNKAFSAKVKRELVRLASDESAFVRIAAVRGLTHFRDPSDIQLLTFLASYDPYEASEHGGEKGAFPVRNAAEQALTEFSRLR